MGRSPRGGHGNPLQYSCLENPMDRGAWQATVHRVTKSQTQLKRLSSSSSSSIQCFPGSSAGKESTCNAGDPSSIPGSGRSPGEGIGSPLQYSWASLVAWTVKHPTAMQETWVRSLSWEDPMEEGMATPLQYSCLENPMHRGTWRATVHGVAELDMAERLTHTIFDKGTKNIQ